MSSNLMYRDDIPLQDVEARHDRLPDWRNGQFVGIKPYRARCKQLAEIAETDPELRPRWRELRDWFDPEAGRYLYGDFCNGVPAARGGNDGHEVKRSRRKIVNSVAANIINTCSAGIKYAFTSAQKPWFLFAPSDKALLDNIETRLWLDATRDTIRDALAQSNFYAEMDKVYKEASEFGFGVLFSEPDPQRKLNYIALTVGECVLDEDSRGNVDTCYWRMDMTAKQLADKFGKDNKGFTEEVRRALTMPGHLSDTFVLFRAVQPINTFGDAPVSIQEDWKYESVYFLDGADKQHEKQFVLRWEWHRTCPFVAVRWKRAGRHVYGTCPGKDVLADQKLLQMMTTNGMNASELQLNPPLVAGQKIYQQIIKKGRVSPGSIVMDDGSTQRGQQAIQPIYQVQPDFTNYRLDREEVIQRIKDAFYFDQWRAIVNVERQMTAFEVDARMNEKISLLAPVVESFESQGHTPILERAYSICLYDLGLIYPPPESMAEQEFRIEYEGDYAKGIKQVEVERMQMFIRATLESAVALAQLSPEDARDMVRQINYGEAVKFMSTRYDVSPEVMRDAAEVDEMARRDAEAAEQQQAAIQAQGAVEAAEKLGNTPVNGANALGDIMSRLGGGSMYAV